MPLLPSLFLSHGAPTLALENNPTTDFFSALGQAIGKPQAVLCISAHWETDIPSIMAWKRAELIYDFYGFPEALYTIEYSSPGHPAMAKRVQELLKESGIESGLEMRRGLDHGAWIPLRKLYPEGDIPILQLSLQTQFSTQYHYDLGRALSALRQEGVLIVGSGGATHNLSQLDMNATEPSTWSVEFMNWLDSQIEKGDIESLIDYRKQQRFGLRAHPREEHFLPLFVAMGAAEGPGRRLHHEMAYGSLSLSAYAFG